MQYSLLFPMPIAEAALITILIACLTADEKRHGVAYGVKAPLQAGMALVFPKMEIDVPRATHTLCLLIASRARIGAIRVVIF